MTYTAWSVVFGEQPSAAKWNQLGTNDVHFYSFLGDNLAWQPWTPSLSGISIGNGTINGASTKVGRTAKARLSIVFGTTTSVSGDTAISLPYTAISYPGTSNITSFGEGQAFDTSFPRSYPLVISSNSTTLAALRALATDLSFGYAFAFTASFPFAWDTGDEIGLSLSYETAS